MAVNTNNTESVERLMMLLASSDGAIRKQARHVLVDMGEKVISNLAGAFKGNAPEQVRWEVSMALAAMNYPAVIEPLVMELNDPFPDAAWVAAEGLNVLEVSGA